MESDRKAIKGSYADPSVCARIEHHPVAWQVIEQLQGYQNRLAEAKAIEDGFLLTSQNEASSPEQFYRERAKQERRLDRPQRSIACKAAGIRSVVREAIRSLKETISRAESELDWATWDKRSLERGLEEASAFLRTHSLDDLDEDEIDCRTRSDPAKPWIWRRRPGRLISCGVCCHQVAARQDRKRLGVIE